MDIIAALFYFPVAERNQRRPNEGLPHFPKRLVIDCYTGLSNLHTLLQNAMDFHRIHCRKY